LAIRTPVTLITGPLGSGKTTLVRHLLETVHKKIAILMNEFGEIAIDSRIIEGKSVRIAELGGGCVCCSLLGEFEVAVEEVLNTVHPDLIVVETTGVAEPDALVFNIQEELPQVRLDGVITIADADAIIRYPQLGHTTRLQIEAADLILLNKSDLVSPEQLVEVREQLAAVNAHASILPTQRCQVDPDILFGIAHARELTSPHHRHQPEVESFSYSSEATLQRRSFERFVASLSPAVWRAKGFVRFPEGSYLFNFVSGRWELEPFPAEMTTLVFIGPHLASQQEAIRSALQQCTQ
jgi:G3E family GTPase